LGLIQWPLSLEEGKTEIWIQRCTQREDDVKTHKEKAMGGRDWSHMSTSQVMPRSTINSQKVGEKNSIYFPQSFEHELTLDFYFWLPELKE
jgi:hypothetical protein